MIFLNYGKNKLKGYGLWNKADDQFSFSHVPRFSLILAMWILSVFWWNAISFRVTKANLFFAFKHSNWKINCISWLEIRWITPLKSHQQNLYSSVVVELISPFKTLDIFDKQSIHHRFSQKKGVREWKENHITLGICS